VGALRFKGDSADRCQHQSYDLAIGRMIVGDQDFESGHAQGSVWRCAR
jgi:hypothetical protein